MTILIPNLAIAGYRSFGRVPQFFERFAKVNIFIGKNNAGKSNLLRFLCEIYPQVGKDGAQIDRLARHLPDQPPLLLGVGESLDAINPKNPTLPSNHERLAGLKVLHRDTGLAALALGKLLLEKARIDGTSLCWTLLTLPGLADQQESWAQAAKVLRDVQIRELWTLMTGMGGGNRQNWEQDVVQRLPISPPAINAHLIPAIRRIGEEKDSKSNAFDGTGLIERVARLQNPDVHSQKTRESFHAIRDFLREVTDRTDAEIEVPYDRDTILIHMDGKVLPIESLGSGLHEVLIIAAAATTISNQVICIEEPELHLNPILQKKLMRHLANCTSNQYFITTHSATLMDIPGAEVYHIRLHDGASVVERATTDQHRSDVCQDLGYHPSDLLQANCLIWVEGPSDRIYINWWFAATDPNLIEGIHYSVMFYGGRLASHLSNAPDSAEAITAFISLRPLNRRGVIIIDSDRDRSHKPINATKSRLRKEFNAGPGHAWITAGREIENYLPFNQIKAAIATVHPKATATAGPGKYDKMLSVRRTSGKVGAASKVDVARYIVDTFQPDFSVLDLRKRIQAIQRFIWESNPKIKGEHATPT